MLASGALGSGIGALQILCFEGKLSKSHMFNPFHIQLAVSREQSTNEESTGKAAVPGPCTWEVRIGQGSFSALKLGTYTRMGPNLAFKCA